MKILIIEDNPAFARSLKTHMDEYEVQLCYTADQAWQELSSVWDLYLIDIGLPDGDGLSLVQEIRSRTDHPILVISASRQEGDMITGYRRGIDDYIEKPVRLPVLQEKIRAMIRNRGLAGKKYEWHGIVLDVAAMRLQAIPLTKTETCILTLLMQNPGQYVGMESLERALPKEYSSSSLSSRISELRRKVKKAGLCLEGRRTTGYRLAENHEVA